MLCKKYIYSNKASYYVELGLQLSFHGVCICQYPLRDFDKLSSHKLHILIVEDCVDPRYP